MSGEDPAVISVTGKQDDPVTILLESDDENEAIEMLAITLYGGNVVNEEDEALAAESASKAMETMELVDKPKEKGDEEMETHGEDHEVGKELDDIILIEDDANMETEAAGETTAAERQTDSGDTTASNDVAATGNEGENESAAELPPVAEKKSTETHQSDDDDDIVMIVDEEPAATAVPESKKQDDTPTGDDALQAAKTVPVTVQDVAVDSKDEAVPPVETNGTGTEEKSTAILNGKGEVNGTKKTLSKRFECVNPECLGGGRSQEMFAVTKAVLNYYGVPQKTRKQRVCEDCYNAVYSKYLDLCMALTSQQPILLCETPRKVDLVEISDSSEEDEPEDEYSNHSIDRPLPETITNLLEEDLNDVLSRTFKEINIKQQMDWTKSIIQQKIEHNGVLSTELGKDLCDLQKKFDTIHTGLYMRARPRFRHLKACNILHEIDMMGSTVAPNPTLAGNKESPQIETVNLPAKKEEFARPPVAVGNFYFGVKVKLLTNWVQCQVVEKLCYADKILYKINFIPSQPDCSTKLVAAKNLAYRTSFNVRLPLGTRVIARFDGGTASMNDKTNPQGPMQRSNSFYAGFVAEPYGKYNRNRYLIFFDDGYAQYVNHADVRVVCEQSKDVWEDIHPHSRDFTKNYLMSYRSERPMVQMKIGMRIMTELKGLWVCAKVIDIDASLVQLHFLDENRFEWIYRGSTRLSPLYQEKTLKYSKASNKVSKLQGRNEPSVEYITLDDEEDNAEQAQPTAAQANTPTTTGNRSVAKKSTAPRPSQPSAVFMNSSTIYCEDDRPKGKVVYYTAKKHMPPLKYKPHHCNPNCLFKITHNLKSYNSLAKPLLSGWERQLCKLKYKKSFVVYRAPCGRRLRNMQELHRYLRLTESALNVENFAYDPIINCLAEYVIDNHIIHLTDLSDGREYMAVPCANYYDDTRPPPCIYSTERIPTEGVHLNLDENFLCGCDCEDDCSDKTKCQCWQMTIAGAKFGKPNTPIESIGYVYKRLPEMVLTGIYECNSRCKCKMNCLNRVVQHPLQVKLQVFKTNNRGWGIRCLNDVPKGSFICIYSGHLLTEEAGNEICEINGNNTGDEYFADLDYIETVQQMKEGYESDVVESEEDDSDGPVNRRVTEASDEEFKSSSKPSKTAIKTRAQAAKRNATGTPVGTAATNAANNDGGEREPVNLEPSSKGKRLSPSEKAFRGVRRLYGKNEKPYIMDAKKSGNLGRYFNHSCSPNLFVQNVFVDTHDLRFPWVAFFALSNIGAGVELTWNYNYDVGSVPGKVLYCQCGASNCRIRLL